MSNTITRTRITLFGLALACLLLACGKDSLSPSEPLLQVADIEYQSFQLINGSRRDASVEPQLALPELLSQVAREHSERMRNQGFFDHVDPSGADVRSRLRSAGISFTAVGENLARVHSSPDPATQLHQDLMASPTHRANILSDRFEVTGVGVARSADSYWLTQIFVHL